MDISEIKNKVNEALKVQLGVTDSDISPDASLDTDLGCDSLDLIELVMDLEERFEVEIDDADAEKFYSVGDIYAYFNNRLRVSIGS